MVLEVALFDVTDPDGFAAAYRGVHPIIAGAPGARSVRMTAGIESATRFVLLVEWDSVEAHDQNFRETERFTAWRAAIGPFFANPPLVEHFSETPEAEPTR